jgi:hypothetical protein
VTPSVNTIEVSRWTGRIVTVPLADGVTDEQLGGGWGRGSRSGQADPLPKLRKRGKVRLSPVARAVLHELAVARADWRTWKTSPIPVATLAAALDYSDRHVQRGLGQLVCAGLIRRELATYAASTFTVFVDRVRALGEVAVDRVRAGRARVREAVDQVRTIAKVAVEAVARPQGHTPEALAEEAWTRLGAFEAVEAFWDHVRVRDLFKHQKKSGLTLDGWRAEHELVASAVTKGLTLPRDPWRPRNWGHLLAAAKRVASAPRRLESNLPVDDPPEQPRDAGEAWRRALAAARVGDLEEHVRDLPASWDPAGRLVLRVADRDQAELVLQVVNGWRVFDVAGPVVTTW